MFGCIGLQESPEPVRKHIFGENLPVHGVPSTVKRIGLNLEFMEDVTQTVLPTVRQVEEVQGEAVLLPETCNENPFSVLGDKVSGINDPV